MSSAFTRERDGEQPPEDLPDRPISPHPNFVTPEGLARIEAEVARLEAELAVARGGQDREALARLKRDLRYWAHRRSSAEVVHRPADTSTVHFGSRVTIARDDGRQQTFRIVGEDESDPAQGLIAYVSPLARALTGRAVGDVVQAGQGEAEIVAID